jgi:hypothetical protein
MPRIDAIYTPSLLAKQMVETCSSKARVVADFASGDGELLLAASGKWPRAKLIATDISQKALNQLSGKIKGAETARCNFLSVRSRSRCSTIQKWRGKINLALLNPPFSYRGGTRISISTQHFRTSCSPAMAFILHAFEYLSSDGEISAILPAGSLGAERDRDAWRQIRDLATVDILSQYHSRTFVAYSPTTKLVHIKRGADDVAHQSGVTSSTTRPLVSKKTVLIQRGTIQMHSVPNGNVPLAHSTDLANFRLVLNGHKTIAGLSSISGPFVAICRVGNPKEEKVALHYAPFKIAISDCIIALRCESKNAAKQLHSELIANWKDLAHLYTGTGARYITVAKIAAFVKDLGFDIAPHSNAKSQLRRSVESAKV